ncbi:hypothetical protein BDV93DRAFT_559153 [Ceratobasidium sp. AG-I]|nr:hypothetical protein BDV93DRAFT_559153 [Ceratobasidium sp. AG-I]
MSWSRTLLRVIAWIVLIGPNLPGSLLANPGRPAPPSTTEPSLLGSILDLLPAPIRLLYPLTPPYVEPLSFTLTSPTAWLCSPSLSSHGHYPPPDRSCLSASREYVVRSASSLAERASAVVWLATPHALFGSKPAALLSRTSARARQALFVMRLQVVNPVFDMIVRPKSTMSTRKRGRSCTYIHRPTKSPSAFPSIHMVGEAISNWMDMVLARLDAVLSFMVNNLEYAQLWVKSFGQHAYDHPDALFVSISGSPPLILDELWSIGSRLGSLVLHILSSPSVIFNYYRDWFAPHLVAGARIVTEILSTLEQVSIFVEPLSSILRSVVHYVHDITSSALSSARNVMRDSHLPRLLLDEAAVFFVSAKPGHPIFVCIWETGKI